MSKLEGVHIRRTTTAHQVAEAISQGILQGAFPPGERLREAAIANELGVARNTVREAVRILALGGLVQHEVNRGAVVIAPSGKTVHELYLARDRLETTAVTRKADEPALDQMQSALDDLDWTAVNGDAQGMVQADLAFHAAIVGLHRSERLNEFFATLMLELQYYLTVLSRADREIERAAATVAEHRAIYDAIRTNDRELARDLLGEHIAVNSARLGQILRDREKAGAPDAGWA